MKYLKALQILVIGLVVSTAAVASAQDDAEPSATMPMMNQGGNMMMNPQMMQQMMSQMPHMGYGHGPGYGMPMMGQGMGNIMMNPQMMQMRMQHMQKMEQHLANIESLLAQILEAQKSK